MSYWNGKVALVTGASGGLGLSIVSALVARGARVVLCARGNEALEAAAAGLRERGGDVLVVPADVTQQDQVDSLVLRTIDHFGRLDLLVNNAGRSMRKSVLETTPAEFEDLFELNLVAVVRMVQACLPHLRATGGSIANISSLAGKSAARWLGAYPASKFALSAYTHQLRLELADASADEGAAKNIHVLLVCPGPIARNEPRSESRYDGAGLPDRALKPGAGVRTNAIDPAWLAGKILLACERRRAELIVPRLARFMFVLMQISPGLADWLVRKMT
jgi:NAD(P)-dependent dehydrogenase (short-subunit alcohol dehydrogenase family)